MVCLIIDALIRFMFIIQNSFLLFCGRAAAVQRSAQAAGFARRNRSRFLSGKKCEKMLQLIISLDLLEAFSHTLVTRDDEDDDLVIHPSIESDG